MAEYLKGERSIPACAGKPGVPRDGAHPGGVYPRVCGGTQPLGDAVVEGRGLSPRVRGNLRHALTGQAQLRSIPACAGEPYSAAGLPAGVKVYPRVCGGTARLQTQRGRCSGLSPRVRGNLQRGGPACGPERSIPACAGEPMSRASRRASVTVYPRVCGGTACRAMSANHGGGLSPRVRGNLAERAAGAKGERSIPACAGEPVHADRFCSLLGVYLLVPTVNCTFSPIQNCTLFSCGCSADFHETSVTWRNGECMIWRRRCCSSII